MSERVENWNIKTEIIESIKYYLILCFRGVQHALEWIPVNNSRVCLVSVTRKGFTDNLKYTALEIRRKNPEMELILATRYPDSCDKATKNGIKVVKLKSIQHFFSHFTSKVIISDDSLYVGYIKRKKQVYINTWHGGINYKKIGFDGLVFNDRLKEKYFLKQNIEPDFMVAGSQFWATNTAKAFHFNKTVFLPIGLPRNDLILNEHEEIKKKIKQIYRCENKKILMYAPTFRSGGYTPYCIQDTEGITNALCNRFGGDWVIWYRTHYFIERYNECINSNIIDVSRYDDMQELLCCIDVLISDYSSCMWDCMLMGKPVISFTPDEEKYLNNDRGFTEAWNDIPYIKATNEKEIQKEICHFDSDKYKRNIEAHKKKMGCYDQGNAKEKLVQIIIDMTKEDKHEKGNNLRNI